MFALVESQTQLTLTSPCDVAADPRADGEILRARGRPVAVEADDVPCQRGDRQSGACYGRRQQRRGEHGRTQSARTNRGTN